MIKPVTASEARRIAHDVVGEHINHPAPEGHKGLEKLMPDPHKGEKLSTFVSRYMGSKKARKHFPKKSQRAAVAYSEAREAKLKK